MRTRNKKDVIRSLEKKGFVLDPQKDDHIRYYFVFNGKKTKISTFFSHSPKDYPPGLMSAIKRQMKFTSNQDAEDFFDCPFTQEMYESMLVRDGHVRE